MFWGCFCWGFKGPCYIWPKETAALRKKYDKIMGKYNKSHEADDRAKWEAEEVIRRSTLKRPPKKMREWKYTAERGAMTRDRKKGGIDWMRYQYETLRPRFLPFMRQLGPDFVAQEDNAPCHASKWNRRYWEAAGVTLMFWPPNSPDLSAIEPPWRHLKFKQGAKGPIWSRKKLITIWKQGWQDIPSKLLQRFVERIQGNIEWVIRLKGGNEYKEGTKPPALTQAERLQLEAEIQDFLGLPIIPEDPSDPWVDIVDEIREEMGYFIISDGEEDDPMVETDEDDEDDEN